MMFCYRCGEETPYALWSTKHGCCKDCAEYYDLDRFEEREFYCSECMMPTGVGEDGCCSSCGAQAEIRPVGGG
jgi:hypothetical protein